MPIPSIPRGKTIAYDENLVPSAMPMPLLQSVVVNKNEEYGVPHLNDLQRAFSKTVFADYDMENLTNDDRAAIKKKILDGKPFQHRSGNAEVERKEEAAVATQIADAITQERAKLKAKREDHGDSGKDLDAVRTCLRGFPIIGWNRAIQKAMSNEKNNKKLMVNAKATKTTTATPASGSGSLPASPPNVNTDSGLTIADAMRILDLVGYTARQKFATDQREEILALARTYEGTNAGGNFNRATRELWETADKDKWEAAKESELEEIAGSPPERMAMLLMALCSALSKIQDSGRFPAFFATLQLGYIDGGKMVFEIGEAMPAGSSSLAGFKEKNEKEYEQYLSRMHMWGRDVAGLDIELIPAAEITTAVVEFLASSYEHVHQTRTIPWDEIVAEPRRFFDPERLRLTFTLNDPMKLKAYERVQLAAVLCEVAGPGTANFFDTPPTGEDEAKERERVAAELKAHDDAERERVEAEAAAAKERERAAAEQEAHDEEAEPGSGGGGGAC
ncbi:hypothetical protein C8F01DRAFT_1263510 [Mycena amicta]|nr:hypothetical protein C8F01DRAFT_1263510 [Mycena amicta]